MVILIGRKWSSHIAIGSCYFLEVATCQICAGQYCREHYIDPLHFRDTLNSYKRGGFLGEPVLTQSAGSAA